MSDSPFEALLSGWDRERLVSRPEGSPLPSHHPNCLGCGTENPHGYHLVVVRNGRDAVTATHTFDQKHVGAPGIAHGGAVATVLDDLYGFLLYSSGHLAVTRKLEVEYLRPVLLDVEYTLRATLVECRGRKIHMTATLEDANGALRTQSNALFVTVDLQHFTSQRLS